MTDLEKYEAVLEQAKRLVKAEKAKIKASDKFSDGFKNGMSGRQHANLRTKLDDWCLEIKYAKDRLHCNLVNADIIEPKELSGYDREIIYLPGQGGTIETTYFPPVPDCMKDKVRKE